MAATGDKVVCVGAGRPTLNVYDEDAMGSDSDSGLATQQSIKAYVDARATAGIVDEDDMASDSAVLVPTQQSVKAYADALRAALLANGGVATGLLTGVGAKNGATVTAVEAGDGMIHKTILTLAATPITMRNTEQGGGVKVYDFPDGCISILGAFADLAMTTTSILANTLNSGVTCNMGVGTITQANATVANTEQNIVNVAAWTAGTTINVAAAAAQGKGNPTVIDGSGTALDAFLNLAVAGADDIDGDATITVSGTITILWSNLGDKA
jgi:hypothetical protein